MTSFADRDADELRIENPQRRQNLYVNSEIAKSLLSFLVSAGVFSSRKFESAIGERRDILTRSSSAAGIAGLMDSSDDRVGTILGFDKYLRDINSY
jgi:hypothetical protein